jgi:hypothetical protein
MKIQDLWNVTSLDHLALKKEAVHSFETLVNIYQPTRHNIAEDLHQHSTENPKIL